MINFIYQLLADIGFTHPLHPAITHLPMGGVMIGFLFAITSLYFKNSDLAKSAFYCYLVALVFVLPTMLLGYMDWQYKFDGEWSGIIIAKIIMACVLGILLIFATILGSKEDRVAPRTMVVYTLCLLAGISMGFLGGELQYG